MSGAVARHGLAEVLNRARAELTPALTRRRRLIAALAVAGAALATLQVLAPGDGARVTVLRAAHDLDGSSPLQPTDLRALAIPTGAVPDGALRDPDLAVGRMLSGPVRRGETLTDARLLDGRLALGDGQLAVGIRVSDPGIAGLVRPGSFVDVLATAEDAFGPSAGSATVVGWRLPVLAVPASEAGPAGPAFDETLAVVLAADPEQAARLAWAEATSRLSLALHPSPPPRPATGPTTGPVA